jgi:hypothetical protein
MVVDSSAACAGNPVGTSGLPDDWGVLNLTELAVIDCGLTQLPAGLARMSRLRTIHASSNRIALDGVPVELLRDSGVVELALLSNPLDLNSLRQREGYDQVRVCWCRCCCCSCCFSWRSRVHPFAHLTCW